MTRMESIRRQYEGSAAQPPQAGGGRAYPARPRNVFWRWFWFFFLLALLGGFFAAKGTLSGWLERMRGRDANAAAGSVSAVPAADAAPAASR